MAERPLTSPLMAEGMPLGSLPALHAANKPLGLALSCGSSTLTWRDLELQANQMARVLMARGVGQDDVVSVVLPNSADFVVVDFAIWILGAIPNGLSHRSPAAELSELVEIVNARLVIVAQPLSLPRPCVALEVLLKEATRQSDAPLPERVSSHWRLGCSGGSTGRPKAILNPLAGRWDPKRTTQNMKVGETILMPGPLYHTGPFHQTHWALFSGCPVVLMERFDAETTLRLVEQYTVRWMFLVPTMMRRIWLLPHHVRDRYDISSLNVVGHAAGMCPIWLKQAWIDWLGPEKIIESYGGTEDFGNTVITGEEWLSHKGSVGKPSPGYSIVVLDSDRREVPTGQIGVIWFDGIQGRTTYNDLGHLDSDGYLYLADRRTDLIISGGANIYPAEVEAAIDQHPCVATSVVIGLADEDLGQRVHALVELRPEVSPIDEKQLLLFLAQRLVRYKLPRSVEFTLESLRNEAGKARRWYLRDERSRKQAANEGGKTA